MKALAIWSLVVAVALGGFAVVASLTRDTTRVLVVVDSSFPMRDVWSQVGDELDRIDNRDHAEFALATEKKQIHGWEPELSLLGVEPFAPCTFETIRSLPEAVEADERILISTAGSCDTKELTEWEIRLLSRR